MQETHQLIKSVESPTYSAFSRKSTAISLTSSTRDSYNTQPKVR